MVTELVVVVLGILIALGIDSWWARRETAKLEQAFLVQLRDDLSRAAEQLRGELESTENAQGFTLRVLEVARGETLPPNDTLAGWLKRSIYWSDPQPTVSTAQALAESDKLYVLRNPAVRNMVVGLIDRVRQLESRLAPFEQRIFDAQSTMHRWIDPAERGVQLEVGMLGSEIDAFRRGIEGTVEADLLPVMRRPELLAVFLDVFMAQENLRWYQQEMLNATMGLREVVQAEIRP